MWSGNNAFAEIAEETDDDQCLSHPVVPEERAKHILSSFEVKPSADNEVTYRGISSLTYSLNVIINLNFVASMVSSYWVILFSNHRGFVFYLYFL